MRIKKQNEEKTIRKEIFLTENNNEKIKDLAIKSKLNQSKIINNLIENVDEGLKIFEAFNYIKSREMIFVEVAKLAENLKRQQEEFTKDIKQIKEELEEIKQIKTEIKEYKNKTIETQNKLVTHILKSEELLKNVEETLTKKENGLFKKFGI